MRNLKKFIEIINSHTTVLICGDFNAFHHNWGSNYLCPRGILINNNMDSLILLNNGRPTRIATSAKHQANPLDLTWISADLFDDIVWALEDETLGSDHLVISITMFDNMNSEVVKIKEKIDPDKFRMNIEGIKSDDINTFEEFVQQVETARESAIKQPPKLRNPKYIPKPYWTEAVKKAHANKKFALVAYLRYMTAHNLTEFNKQNAIFKRILKKERIRTWREWSEKINPQAPVGKIFRDISRLSKCQIPAQRNYMYDNPDQVEEFLKILCDDNSELTNIPLEPCNIEASFVMSDLEKILNSKKDTAPGMDSIRYSHILNFPENLKSKFLELVNELWATQNVPEMLKKILMVLIPKPNRDPKVLTSHRPISLLSVYLKVVNSLVKDRLENWLLENTVIDENSYGFVKGRSAVNCITHLVAILEDNYNNNLVTMGTFIDLQDAFNKINLKTLQRVLNGLNVPKQIVNWIIESYKHR